MERQDFTKRFLLPVSFLFVVMSASWAVYTVAWRIDHRILHQTLAAISGTILFLSVTFGALFIYPKTYFRGASLRERIAACLVNPLIWMTKENIRLYISYSFAESLYYYLNPLNVWLLLGIVSQMGLAEIFCRWRLARRGEETKILSPGALAAFVFGLLMAISFFAWGEGEGAYVIFLSGYRRIFGSGL